MNNTKIVHATDTPPDVVKALETLAVYCSESNAMTMTFVVSDLVHAGHILGDFEITVTNTFDTAFIEEEPEIDN